MARDTAEPTTNKTTIWADRSTVAGLRKLEEYPRQPLDEIIRTLINYHEIRSKGVDPQLLKSSGKRG